MKTPSVSRLRSYAPIVGSTTTGTAIFLSGLQWLFLRPDLVADLSGAYGTDLSTSASLGNVAIAIGLVFGVLLVLRQDVKTISLAVLLAILVSILTQGIQFGDRSGPTYEESIHGLISVTPILSSGIARGVLLCLTLLVLLMAKGRFTFSTVTVYCAVAFAVLTLIVPVDRHRLENAAVREISSDVAYSLFLSGEALFVDARDQTLFLRKHIAGAVSLPYGRATSKMENTGDLESGLHVVTYCDSKVCTLAGLQARELVSIVNYPIYVLRGGIETWQEAGHLIEGSDAPH